MSANGQRIVVTGAGILSAIGLGKDATLEALRTGRSGVRLRAHFPLPVGEVSLSDQELQARTGHTDLASRTSLLGMAAVAEALQEAELPDGRDAALICGTTVGGMDLTDTVFPELLQGERPEVMALHDCGASSEAIARHFGGFRFATTLSTACASAADALLLGARLIRAGKTDIVVAGGSESLSRFHFNGFRSLMILSDAPCQPFDVGRKGLNLGEGAAFLVLESEAHAAARGARIRAILSGWGNACDAYHQTASSENGEGAFLAMQQALACAGLSPADIDYVNAHGTGTPNNDASESAALRRIFTEALPPVSSTKGFTGHTTSACGSIEALICLLAMQESFLPASLGFRDPDPACIRPTAGGTARLRHVMCNAFAFGGNDCSLIFSAA